MFHSIALVFHCTCILGPYSIFPDRASGCQNDSKRVSLSYKLLTEVYIIIRVNEVPTILNGFLLAFSIISFSLVRAVD